MKMAIVSLALLLGAVSFALWGSDTVCDICREILDFESSLPESAEGIDESLKRELMKKGRAIAEKWDDRGALLAAFVPSQSFTAQRHALDALIKLIELENDDEYAAMRAQLKTYTKSIYDAERFGILSIF